MSDMVERVGCFWFSLESPHQRQRANGEAQKKTPNAVVRDCDGGGLCRSVTNDTNQSQNLNCGMCGCYLGKAPLSFFVNPTRNHTHAKAIGKHTHAHTFGAPRNSGNVRGCRTLEPQSQHTLPMGIL